MCKELDAHRSMFDSSEKMTAVPRREQQRLEATKKCVADGVSNFDAKSSFANFMRAKKGKKGEGQQQFDGMHGEEARQFKVDWANKYVKNLANQIIPA